MKKTHQNLSLAVIGLCLALMSQLAWAKVQSTQGVLERITVYRGQALVTRSIELDLPQNTSEIVVTNLPGKIIPETLYAQADSDLKVLSVRYRERAVREDTREEVQKLDAQIEIINNQIYHLTRKKQHLDNQWDMFIKLRDFTVNAKTADLNHGVLTYEPIEKLTELILKKSREYIEQTLKFEDDIKQAQKNQELLQRQRQNLTSSHSRSEREAVLFVNSPTAKKSNLQLSYLVTNANWQPLYNLRAHPDQQEVTIEYNALINQTSGENWDNVHISLSTAQPTMVAAAATLDPLTVRLSSVRAPYTPMHGSDKSGHQMGGMKISAPQANQMEEVSSNQQRFRRIQQMRSFNISKGKTAQQQLARIALDNQLFEFEIGRKELSMLKEQLDQIARVEGISVTYKLPGKLSLPSRSDQQMATIAATAVKAEFTLIATPLMTDYIYLQAELLNNSQTIFLPGSASVFRNGEFAGKAQVPLVTIGEKFTAGFGIDSQIQVSRQLKDKHTRIQGGNRIDSFNYEIALNNYKTTAVKLQLLDRLPYSKNSGIKIDLNKEKISPKLSRNSEYLRTIYKKGILRWDLELPAQTANQNATVVKYSYIMEYDKNMHIQSRIAQ